MHGGQLMALLNKITRDGFAAYVMRENPQSAVRNPQWHGREQKR